MTTIDTQKLFQEAAKDANVLKELLPIIKGNMSTEIIFTIMAKMLIVYPNLINVDPMVIFSMMQAGMLTSFQAGRLYGQQEMVDRAINDIPTLDKQ